MCKAFVIRLKMPVMRRPPVQIRDYMSGIIYNRYDDMDVQTFREHRRVQCVHIT